MASEKQKTDWSAGGQTGKLRMQHIDCGLKELLSTKEAYFGYLIDKY